MGSDVPKSYIEDLIKKFKWAWWLEEDEMKRSMAEEMRETSEILSIHFNPFKIPTYRLL
jgi:hypothetical protein